jgi:hypothetical protein
MIPAYLDPPLEAGRPVRWEWPWQDSGGKVLPGRLKRFEGTVVRWEELAVPAGTFLAARIEGRLRYLDGGKAQAEVRETLWLSPHASQIVKIVREGRSPDEAAMRITAELVELK